jgi:hypothetical protein
MKQQITVDVPKQLEMLCELLETTPQAILQGFVNDLSLEVHYSSGSDERRMAGEYFMRCCYGYHRYDFEQIEQMFDELNWIRLQWPGNDAGKEKKYQQQRKVFLKKWLKDWKAKMKSGQ